MNEIYEIVNGIHNCESDRLSFKISFIFTRIDYLCTKFSGGRGPAPCPFVYIIFQATQGVVILLLLADDFELEWPAGTEVDKKKRLFVVISIDLCRKIRRIYE